MDSAIVILTESTRYAALAIEPGYYNPDLHGRDLALPNDIRALLA